MLGAQIKLDSSRDSDIRLDEILFAEAPSRIVISLNEKNLNTLEKIAKRNLVSCQVLGKTGGEELVVQYKGKPVISLALNRLSNAWREAIPSRLAK